MHRNGEANSAGLLDCARKAKAAPQFVELMTAAPAGGSECVIELEGKHGKMRIHWKGITASDLAELSRILVMKVPLRTLFTWIARYRKGGDHALREGQRSGRPRKLDAAMMQWLYKAITLGEPRQYQLPFCLWTLALVRLLLKRKYGIELSKSGVSRLLGHLGLSPQRPIYRSYKRNPEDMKRYLDETFPGLRDRARRMGAIIYFVDEASVRSDSHRGTTWGKIGQTPEVEDSGDRFSLKLISAVSPRGDMKFSCFEGRMNGPRFVNFLKKLHSDAGRPIIIITDGASYHTSGPVKRYAAESQEQVTIEHLPSYSPELNPDEQVWNHAKARLAKRFVANKAEFKAAILITFRVVAQTQMICLQGLAEDQVPMQKRHVIAALTTNLRQRHQSIVSSRLPLFRSNDRMTRPDWSISSRTVFMS